MLSQIGDYQVLDEVGRGGMGVVYRALDPMLQRTVAIKAIQAGNPLNTGNLKERFLREARSNALLSHPNIVGIHHMAEQDDCVYIVMEFIDGPTLESWLSSDPPPSREAMLAVLRQLAAGLDHAHLKGVVHRDIKPMNILIQDGAPRITDFGLAKVASSFQLTQTGTQVGTPHYMSPEQAQGHHVDGKSDQFSLAVIAYRMLTGEKPFDADRITTLMFKIVYEEPPPPQTVNPSLEGAVNSVFARALAKDPFARFPTCSDFVSALESSLAPSPPVAATSPPASAHEAHATPPRAFGRGSGKTLWIAVAAGVTLLLAATVVFRDAGGSIPAKTATAKAAAAQPPTGRSPVRKAPAAASRTGDGDTGSALTETPKPPRPLPPIVPLVTPRAAAFVGGMADWERPNEWTDENGWLVRRGGGLVLYRVTPTAGEFSFTATMLKGRRLQWVLDLDNPDNYGLYQLEKRRFAASDVVNGKEQDRTTVSWPEDHGGYYVLRLEVASDRIVTRLHDGARWVVLDRWTQPGRDFSDGKFGFLVTGSDAVGIANFRFTSNRRR